MFSHESRAILNRWLIACGYASQVLEIWFLIFNTK